jgi:NMD protein affecting ribosome stability and mRNA decay
MVDFLQNVVPVRARHDKQLVSHDANNNSYNYQYTFCVEITPICKEDIVCLPHKAGGVPTTTNPPTFNLVLLLPRVSV